MLAGPIAALPLAVMSLQAPPPTSGDPDPRAVMLPSGLDSDERVLLFPTAAALDESTQEWRVPIRFMVYEPEEGDAMRAFALAPLRQWLALEPGSAEARTFAKRARLFLVDHERREYVHLSIGELRRRLGPTGSDGCCETIVDLPSALAGTLAPDGRLPLAIGPDGDPTGARGAVFLVPPEGLSVISDIDDTIKVTNIADRRATLRATFLEEFRAVTGMAELYRKVAAREPSVAFHYVSLSPWQLAPLFEQFLADAAFPPGSLHLQPFRIQDGDFGDLFGDSRARKLAAIEPVLSRWPRRRFVLVGDSGQADPEVYAELARRHAPQIERIWIRETVTLAAKSTPQELATAKQRYAAAFADVPGEKWKVFEEPAKLDEQEAR